MYPDKTVRRRRAVLALLVISSLLLITAYFGESAGGGLHAFQRGVSAVVSPLQSGASAALKPARDGIGWVGDTFDAKGENADLRKKLELADRQIVDNAAAKRRLAALERMVALNGEVGLDAMGPKAARIVNSSGLVLDQRITINRGSGDGIAVGDPVVTGAGLVGKVDVVTGSNASVQLLTDADFGAAVRVAQRPGLDRDVTGNIEPAPGSPRTLELNYADGGAALREGDIVVTRGTADPRFPLNFPPDVPVGRISDIKDAGADDAEIRVEPMVDVRDVDYVEVITAMDQPEQ